MERSPTKRLRTPILEIAYEEWGDPDGMPIVLLHGFPDDARSWDAVATSLAQAGYRALAPFLRGFGPTRFLRDDTPRVGQLAALAQDTLDFADAIGLDRFALVGHDWGARAAQAVAATSPERVSRLVSFTGYEIAWDEVAGPPSYPQLRALWYQYLLNSDFGPAVLAMDRRGFCRYLWGTWSPTWRVPAGAFEAVAPSFDNPDFVDIVVHGYRHPRPDAPGDPRYDDLEARLAAGPPIAVPTATPPGRDPRFTGPCEQQVLPGVGHFPHRERPDAVVAAILANG